MQITQFLVGASYAMAHSFVSYTVPVTTILTSTVPVDATAAPSDSVAPTVAASAIESIKKFIYGAAEGVAAPGAAEAAAQVYDAKTATTTEARYITQPCITTTGETFAVWLNVLYLAPLTYLFVSFFIASYVKRSNAAGKISGKGRGADVNASVALAERAGWDAAKGIEKEIYNGENMVNGSADETSSTPTPKKSNGKSRRKA